jgi:chorismate dehydratase
MPQNSGCLLIGDKTFGQHQRFAYIYDLAQAWQTYTGLPFAFAVWIAHKNVSPADIQMLNNALTFGINSLDAVVAQWQPQCKNVDVARYLSQDIDYVFDTKKRDAMHLFLTKINLW